MQTPDFAQAIVFTGGGTGGHYFPAVALAEGVKARWPERPVTFVGARRGIEGRQLPESGWPHLILDVEGFVGRSPLRMAQAAWKLWRATARLKVLWKVQRPLAVVGTGGYGAAPALAAARSLGIPYFLHESNAAPGALVRRLAKGARRVWCGVDAVAPLLPGADCLTVGTPLRSSFLRPFKPVKELRPPYQLLVMGGSGGARAINDGMMIAAPALLEQFPEWTILHQAGRLDYERLKDQPRHERHQLVPFIDDVAGALEQSSFVVCRAGAGTCAELRAVGRAALMIPMPGSAGDHQRHNGEEMARSGRVVLTLQRGPLEDFLEAHCASHMGPPYPRLKLAGKPEPNRAVELCVEDLAKTLTPP